MHQLEQRAERQQDRLGQLLEWVTAPHSAKVNPRVRAVSSAKMRSI